MAGHRSPIRLLTVIAAAVTLSGGIAVLPAGGLEPGVPFAATAVVNPHVVLHGQPAVDTAVVLTNVEGQSIGSVQIKRPNGRFVAPATCGEAPAGWTGTALLSSAGVVDSCRFESAPGEADNITAGTSATFHVIFPIQTGSSDVLPDSWQVLADTGDTFEPLTALPATAPSPGDLDVAVKTFEVTRAVVATGSGPAPGTACPPANQVAPVGDTRTIVVCGNNRGTQARTPGATASTLSGTLVMSPGTFSSASIGGGATNVVLAKYTGATITNSAGSAKTVIAKVGSTTGPSTSAVTTLTGFSAYGVVTHLEVSSPTDATAGAPISVTVAAKDAAGVTNPEYVGTLHFSSSDGAAGLPADFVLTSGDGGSHTFAGDVTLKTAGEQSIDISDGTYSASANVAVYPGPPSQLRVETAPDGGGTVVSPQVFTAGDSITLYSVSRDEFGNFVTNAYADAWSLEGAAGSVDADDLVAAPDGKSAVFTGNLVGSATIRAARAGLGHGDTGLITVVHGPAAAITLAGSTADLEVGTSRAFTVTISDAYGNAVTSGPDATATPTFSQIAGGGSVSGTGSVPAVGGEAAKTITASSGGAVTLQASATFVGHESSTASNPLSFAVPIHFTGFLGPVDGPPVVNGVKAGDAIPVTFGLGGNHGLAIFAGGAPTSSIIPCASGKPDAVKASVKASLSTLTYDAGTSRYTYVWKTDKAWKKTCRRLVFGFNDGSTYAADFEFK